MKSCFVESKSQRQGESGKLKERMVPVRNKSSLAPSAEDSEFSKKRTHFMGIVGEAYNDADLLGEEQQRVNEEPGLRDCIKGFIERARLSKEFLEDEMVSSCGYVSKYLPLGLIEQICILRKMFPGIGASFVGQGDVIQVKFFEAACLRMPMLKHAEGLFAIPNWIRHGSIFGDTYQKAVSRMFKAVEESSDGGFRNELPSEIFDYPLEQLPRSVEFWDELVQLQCNPDFLIVPAQFGFRHRGRTARRSRAVCFKHEFPLDTFMIASMLLTHPLRLQSHNDLKIDCSGDGFGGMTNPSVPYFTCIPGLTYYARRGASNNAKEFGTPTGFLEDLNKVI